MHRAWLSILILVSLVVGAATLRRGHEWGDDFAWYIVQARSIWHGQVDEFMAQSAFTNQQSTTHLGPLAYPWGYPLILVPVYAVTGIHPLALKMPGLVFYAGFLTCLYLLMQSRLSRSESLLMVALFAFNPLLLQFLDQILSDIPFLFFSTLSLFLLTSPGDRTLRRSALTGAAIFLTTFLRVTGALLLGSFLIVESLRFLRRRRNRAEAFEVLRDAVVVCLVFGLLWVASLALFPGGGESYLSQYTGLLDTARSMAPAYLNVFSQFFGEGPVWRALYYGLLPFFLVGAWRRGRHEPVFLLFFVFWLLVHIAYPYWQGPRYIFPLLPIFVYFTWEGMSFALDRLRAGPRFAGRTLLHGFWILIAAIFFVTSITNAILNIRNDRAINGPFDPHSLEVYTFIRESTAPDSVVIFFKPRVMVMMTGRPTIMSTECERMWTGDYLVLSRKVGENQQVPPEAIEACDLPLERVLKNNRFLVYHIRK